MPLLRETSAGYMTNLAGRLLVRELELHLTPLGLSPAHMPVLLALEMTDALPQKTLAERAGVEQPTMTATLNRMERDGLVVRMPNPEDGRSMLVALTPLARTRLPEIEKAVAAINAKALAPFSAAERAQFFSLLARLIAALDPGRTDR
ncbi:MarR family winged helix-turn-helix transcriptional regulator [Devosia sp. CAU 1758]